MKTHPLRSLAFLLAFFGLLAACGDSAPRPVAEPDREPPPEREAEPVRFEGSVRLRGELAELGEGYVLVSVKPEGIRMPSLSRKYGISEAEPAGDRELVLRFELDERHLLGGLVPGSLVLEARFDGDGFVESREDAVIATVPVELGEPAEVVLER